MGGDKNDGQKGTYVPSMRKDRERRGLEVLQNVRAGTLFKRWVSRAASSHKDKLRVLYSCPHPNGGAKMYHHFDYLRPFEVIELCPQCHFFEHERLNKIREENNTS